MNATSSYGVCNYTGGYGCAYTYTTSATSPTNCCHGCAFWSKNQYVTQFAPPPKAAVKVPPKNQQLRDELKKLPHNRKKMRY